METKTVYKIGIDKKYAGELTLDNTDKSPSGKWNIPANCTMLKPPEQKDGFNIVWNGKNWEYIEIPQETQATEPTEEEKLLNKINEIMAANDEQIADIKDAMLVAVLTNDTELQEELKQEYASVIEDTNNKLQEVKIND